MRIFSSKEFDNISTFDVGISFITNEKRILTRDIPDFLYFSSERLFLSF